MLKSLCFGVLSGITYGVLTSGFASQSDMGVYCSPGFVKGQIWDLMCSSLFSGITIFGGFYILHKIQIL